MTTPDDDAARAVLARAEAITRLEGGHVNVENYEQLLFRIGAMLATYRYAMTQAGFSENLVETSAWMILSGFFGGDNIERIRFEPTISLYPTTISEGVTSNDQGRPRSVHGAEGRDES